MKTFNLVVRTSSRATMNNFKVFTALLVALCACCGALQAAPAGPHHQQQQQQQQPVVPILKQVNRQNEDGSYSYGYEGADGTFKIETKYPTGEVYGKYGYVDETGKLRTVEYGASSARGFEPAGAGITVPPPVPSVESNDLHRDQPSGREDDYDDGQYREDPSVYYRSETATAAPQPHRAAQQHAPVAARQQWSAAAPKARFQDSRQFQAHPSVQNFDPLTGSFSITYSG